MKHPNPFGLYGMHGNMAEWVADCKFITLEGIPKDGTPRIKKDGCSSGVVRGGGFSFKKKDVTSSSRIFLGRDRTQVMHSVGFRVATDNLKEMESNKIKVN